MADSTQHSAISNHQSTCGFRVHECIQGWREETSFWTIWLHVPSSEMLIAISCHGDATITHLQQEYTISQCTEYNVTLLEDSEVISYWQKLGQLFFPYGNQHCWSISQPGTAHFWGSPTLARSLQAKIQGSYTCPAVQNSAYLLPAPPTNSTHLSILANFQYI